MGGGGGGVGTGAPVPMGATAAMGFNQSHISPGDSLKNEAGKQLASFSWS